MNIERINELARKSRTKEGLTNKEKDEQARLRAEYIKNFRQSIRSQLDNTYVIDNKGNKVIAKEYNKNKKDN